MSNSDNAARPAGTFAAEINRALSEAMAQDENVLLGGQLIKYGYAGITTGLYEKYPERFITYSVSESLMNSATMGLALAGKRPVCFHVRMDFLASGMCALVNHIPVWAMKGVKLPLVIFCQIGRGGGQGPQHSKDLRAWFRNFDGWRVVTPETPQMAHDLMLDSIFGDRPVLYALHRILFNERTAPPIQPSEHIRVVGTSRRHEAEHGY